MDHPSILPIDMTKEQFEAGVIADIYGTANPSIMENQVWKWMISTLHSAWSARKSITLANSFSHTPGWCFQRFGQTKTTLPDGRVVYIAGEHEDGYDPDFFIYNDVIVFNKATPEKEEDITIYGYPVDVFLPTDFHTATYVPGYECIYIIGGTGYMHGRHRREVVVQCLDLGDFSIREVKTSGEKPRAYLSKHTAQYIPAEDGATGKIRIVLSQESIISSIIDSEDEKDTEEAPRIAQSIEDEDTLKDTLDENDTGYGKTDIEKENTAGEYEERNSDSEESSNYDEEDGAATDLSQMMQRENMAANPHFDPKLPFPKVYSLDLDRFTWTYEDAEKKATK